MMMAMATTATTMPSLRPVIILLVGLICLCCAQARDASDYLVHSLPGAPESPSLRMWAGNVEAYPEHHGGLFFWLFQRLNKTEPSRTVIWLNGGPGCSSMDGALMEVGPYRVREGGKLEYNEHAWNQQANLLFVDNPVGVGFSYVDSNAYLHDLNQMADQFVVFLENWFRIFPEYEKDELYLSGESYAGQYIPYIASAITKRNKDTTSRTWNLKGLLIGNGWISPVEQYPSYSSFAYQKGLLETGSEEAQRVEEVQLQCYRTMKNLPGYPNGEGQVGIRECEEILLTIMRETLKPKKPKDKQCINMYDVRLRDEYNACGAHWPPDLEQVKPYLRDPAVLRALNVDTSKKSVGWSECSGGVGRAFDAKHSIPSIKLLPDLLENMPIMLFSGAEDLICNHIGTENLIDNLSWGGKKGFGENAAKVNWMFQGEKVGTWREDRNLTYVLVLESSHMVPFDHPARSLDMLHRFIGIESSRPDVSSESEEVTDDEPIQEEEEDADPTPSNHGNNGLDTSLGDYSQAVQDGEDDAEKSKWTNYYRTGEVALVVVLIAAVAWGWYVYRDRRRRQGYGPLANGESYSDGVLAGVKDVGRGAMRLESFRHEQPDRDLEAAERDELPRPDKYEVGIDDSDAEDHNPTASSR